MRVDLFDYDLPESSIATAPITPREAARLLHLPKDGMADLQVRDLPSLVRPGDVWVLNNTRVIPARLRGKRGEAGVDVTLHKALGAVEWLAFAKPGKKLRVGDMVSFAEDFAAEVLEKMDDGQVRLRFFESAYISGMTAGREWLLAQLARYGEMPLPPYMHRKATEADKADYQSLFARHDGAVAAPTASLHLTETLMAQLREAGAEFVEVTLHVGGGTFLPVKVQDTSDHPMHSEWCEVTPAAAARINVARAKGCRIVAVGTTALRTLESLAAEGPLRPGARETDLFITPGYEFRVVDALLTNFHLPRSTLLMLVSAFSGFDRMRAAYAHAIATGYRFFSYGDACFLERD